MPSVLECATTGMWELLESRLKEGPSPHATKTHSTMLQDASTGQNLLHFAASLGCPVSLLKRILVLLPNYLLKQRDMWMRTPLHTAAQLAAYATVFALLRFFACAGL